MMQQIGNEVREAKEYLPVLYKKLCDELQEFRDDRCDLVFYKKWLFNEEVTIQRVNLCDSLLSSLSSRTISSIKGKTGSEMKDIGSDKVCQVYLKIRDLLQERLKENLEITKQHGVGTGSLQDIFEKYIHQITPRIFSLSEHIEAKSTEYDIRSYAKLA